MVLQSTFENIQGLNTVYNLTKGYIETHSNTNKNGTIVENIVVKMSYMSVCIALEF